jgi:quercetin dioxygenase-like cupin family protein
MYVGTVVKELGPGEGYRIASNVPHHIEILEDAVLIDIFSPKRDDLKATEP